ncbi:MAG: HEAT repeat domain-containing protein [Acidobacteria bacterium]|nr:HEAT repeat domain-containing protein [Acidobacteriota bacterium]
MTPRIRMATAIASLLAWVLLPSSLVLAQEEVSAEHLKEAIDKLGGFDYETRMTAARTVRRAHSEMAVAQLTQAVTGHADSFVRFRALVLLSGFNDPRSKDVMKSLLADPNDRLRQVAYKYFEHDPDPELTPALLQALEKEESEFVRPALIRALAAQGDDPKIRSALMRDVDRGVDFFRSTVIEALGDYRATYAVDAIGRVAKMDGPLQGDAVLALGKIGDKRSLETLAALQQSAPRNLQPTIAAAICLLGINCSSHQGYVDQTLKFAAENPGYQEMLRAAANGLAALAVAGNTQALETLMQLGIPTTDPARAAIALAMGSVALRNTPLLVARLPAREDLDAALTLLQDAFDMLEEDFEEERFFVAIRKTYWHSPEDSPARAVAAALINKLEF